MSELKVCLSEETLNNPQAAIQDLIEASNTIANATENELEKMKNTKWYTRLWKLVTFSKDNQKIMANGISSLAKLQEIIMKALLLLSEQSVENADITRQNSEMIEMLCDKLKVSNEQQFAIITQLNRIKSGIEKPLYLDDLQGDSKIIIINAIVSIAEEISTEDEMGKQYITQLLATAGCTSADIQDNINIACVESLKTKEAQLLYRLCKEYIYICTNDFECESEVFDYINVNKKKANVIEEQICKLVKIAGKEAMLNGFVEKTYDIIEEEDIYFENDIIAEDFDNYEIELDIKDSDISIEDLEEINLSTMVRIENGEVTCFKNKIVKVDTNINCQGNIEFTNCVIYFNERKGSITLSNGASFVANNSSFVCKGRKEYAFINDEGENQIQLIKFERCGFFDCSNFVHLCNAEKLEIIDCKLYNCGSDFVYASCQSIEITNMMLLQDELKLFNIPDDREGIMFKLRGDLSIKNIYIEEAKEFRNKAYEIKKKKDEYVKIDNILGYFEISKNSSQKIEILDSKFFNVINIFYGSGIIKNCIFEECGHALTMYFDESNLIDNCLFYKCHATGYAGIIDEISDCVKVNNCKFIVCKGEIISSSFDRAEINYCEFIGCENRGEEKTESDFKQEVLIKFNGTKCKISKSLFENVDVKYGFIVAGSAASNHSGINIEVENCDFINCASLRKGKKLIKEWDFYYGMFNKRKDIKIVEVRNSSGWENVGTKIAKYNEKQYIKENVKNMGCTEELSEFLPIYLQKYETDINGNIISNNEIFGESSKKYRQKENIDGNKEVNNMEEYMVHKEKVFHMQIEDVFSVVGRGTVIKGSTSEGKVAIGDLIEIIRNDGKSITTKVTRIEIYRKLLDCAQECDNVGLILIFVNKCDVNKGDIAVIYK